MVSIEDFVSITVRNRMAKLASETTEENLLSKYLNRDSVPWSSRPLSYRFVHRIKLIGSRVRDAWLVLIGDGRRTEDY